MKNIRIGNDIIIGWALYDVLGNPYQLKKEFKLSLKCGNYSLDITDYTVEDNKVTFMFYGKDQTVTGVYTLTLIENDDEVGMHTVDCCKVFRMVNTSCESNDYNAINPEVESLDLHSKIDYFPPVTIDKELSGTSENPVQNKVITSKITIIDENITSINDNINNINNNVTQLDTELNNRIVDAIAQESKATDEKIAKEKDALVNGDTIVGQAREIHSRNGKTVTDSFLARTTAGSGTIGDGVASLKSVGGNIVKNLVGSIKGVVYDVIIQNDVNLVTTILPNNSGRLQIERGGVENKCTIKDHIYYNSCMIQSVEPDKVVFGAANIGFAYIMAQSTVSLTTSWQRVSFIRKSTASTVIFHCTLGIKGTATYPLYAKNFLCIDLTEMFGAGNEPSKEECDRLFGTMDALPQGLSFAKPTEFKSTGFNQFNPDNVLEGKAIVNNAIVSGDKKIAVIPCLPCKVGVGENNGYCIHGDFDDDIKVYLTPLNPMDVDGELYMHELTKDATTDTYVPLIKGYMLVEVPTTANLCVHFLWSEDTCDRDSYEPYFESKVELPVIPQMSEWGLAGIQSSGTIACDEIDLEKSVYRKKIKDVELSQHSWWGHKTGTCIYFCDMGKNTNGINNALLCERYSIVKFAGNLLDSIPNKCMMFGGGRYIYIRDDNYTTNTDFKNSLTGLYAYYAIATPEEYPLPKVDNNYISSDYGVEQFMGSAIPCNANNLYYMRSLAGETRNFLDRLYHNTNKTDANEVADYITNGIEDNKQLALRALFVAAGAEYNDSGTDITKTAPWGETVTHKAGHYYLNGIGDITEKQMAVIYSKGNTLNLEYNLNDYKGRTNLPLLSIGTSTYLKGYYYASNCSAEVINLNRGDYSFVIFEKTYDSERVFSNCSKLKAICGRLMFTNIPNVNIFYNSKLLQFVNIYKLKYDLSFATNSIISKESILYMIQNAIPTNTITITLHADAYARLSNDADIVAALAAQPLVTLVSA